MRFSFVRGVETWASIHARCCNLNFAIRVDDSAGDFLYFSLRISATRTKPTITAAGVEGFAQAELAVSGYRRIRRSHVDEMAQIGLGDIVVAQPFPGILFPKDFGHGWSMTADGSNFVRFKIDKYIEGGSSLPERR